MSKRTRGTVRITLDVDYDAGTLGDEAELFGCATVLLALQNDGKLDEPFPAERVGEVAATLIDALLGTNDLSEQSQSAVVRILKARQVR
jgi:hypothetical protein